jgi:broad specificity polyphosphatase/5'/3'-nucleotidase SurE
VAVPSGTPDEGTDIGATAEGHVSITPLQLDLTAYRRLQQLNRWPWLQMARATGNGYR